MPLEQNGFSIIGTHEILCDGKSISELIRLGQYGFVGAGIADRIVIPQHEPVRRSIVLVRFAGTRVMPGHITDMVQASEFERPTPEDAFEFAHQCGQVLLDLEIQRIEDPAKSALVVFPNELTIIMPGRGRYNQIVLGAQGGQLAIRFDHVVPWKSEIAFAFVRRRQTGEV